MIFNKQNDCIEAAVKKEAKNLNIQKVLVALSGGADSIATAFILKNIGLEIIALHCNFHLRGEESDRDTIFVKKFCNENHINIQTIDFNVEAYRAINKKMSIEMACRNLRHQWFADKLQQTGFDRIATGHNADDNIETFLLNMLRGSGTRGLKGMKIDNGTIWRPLLKLHKQEILHYLESNKLDFVVDSTNLQSDYRRNYLRNEIIPLLKQQWKGFETSMDKTINNIEAENALVEYMLKETLPLYSQPLSVKSIIDSPAPLLIIKRYIDPLGPYSSTPEEVLDAIKAKKPHIRKWRLKQGILYLRNGNLFVEMGHGEWSA